LKEHDKNNVVKEYEKYKQEEAERIKKDLETKRQIRNVLQMQLSLKNEKKAKEDKLLNEREFALNRKLLLDLVDDEKDILNLVL
jgi:hypothetical protein